MELQYFDHIEQFVESSDTTDTQSQWTANFKVSVEGVHWLCTGYAPVQAPWHSMVYSRIFQSDNLHICLLYMIKVKQELEWWQNFQPVAKIWGFWIFKNKFYDAIWQRIWNPNQMCLNLSFWQLYLNC